MPDGLASRQALTKLAQNGRNDGGAAMRYGSLAEFLVRGRDALARGPVGILLVEDLCEAESALRHQIAIGLRSLLVFAPEALQLPPELEAQIHRIRHDMRAEGALAATLNPLIAAAPPGTWMHYCYNAEYLYFPFCESRSLPEMLAFHSEERRDAMLCHVIDLYAADLGRHHDAVDLAAPLMDASGYYALARRDGAGQVLDRQLDFFGGLRWRFEEHIPSARRRIDRIGLFRCQPGLRLGDDHRFNQAEYNTFACPWHHNLTAAIMSFRTAKALRSNPGSADHITGFAWHNSVPFRWQSQQLMDLGLMEPGQWF